MHVVIAVGRRAGSAGLHRTSVVPWIRPAKLPPHATQPRFMRLGYPDVPSSRGFAANPEGRPFKILGLQQVAIGGLDKKALTRLWIDILGLEKVGSYESKGENVSEDILKVGHGVTAVEVDLMEPLDPDKSPKVHVPALNHIGLWVHPLPECVEWLTQKGMRFTPGGIRKGAGGREVAFVHPKGNPEKPLSGEGVLIELIQAPPDVVAHSEKE